MNKDQREIQRKLRILRYAEELGHVAKTCRYFGIGPIATHIQMSCIRQFEPTILN